MDNRKNVILADCIPEEVEDFRKGLEESTGLHWEIRSKISNWGRTSKWSEIKRYFAYFTVPFSVFRNRKQYNYIIGWQQFYALIFCFYCNLFRTRKKNTVITLNYTYKKKNGKLGNIYKRFMTSCLNQKYVDYIHVPSKLNADLVYKEFLFPRERIIVNAFGVTDEYEKFQHLACPAGYDRDRYFLSIGRSNRDYTFLIDTWNTYNIQYELVIISDTFTGETQNPYIHIIRNVSGEEQYPWIVNCKCVILPLEDATICSGDTVLLTSMSLEKIVIVTKPSTLSEMYIKEQYNGLAIEKSTEKLSTLIVDVMNGNYDSIKKQARESFLNSYTREKLGTAIGRRLTNTED